MAFSFGIYACAAQNWKITESDNTVILIGEGWIKSLPADGGNAEGESADYYDEWDEEGQVEPITMYNQAGNRIVMINDADQTYAEGTLEDYCKAIKSMQEGVDPAMLQQMIAQQKALPAPELSVTRETGEPIMGYATTKYIIDSDTGFHEEKWISDDPALKEIVGLYREWVGFSSRLVACSVPDASFLNADPEFTEAYRDIQVSGFELMSFRYDSEGTESVREVISIEEGVVPASEFEIPEGYARKGFREFMQVM